MANALARGRGCVGKNREWSTPLITQCGGLAHHSHMPWEHVRKAGSPQDPSDPRNQNLHWDEPPGDLHAYERVTCHAYNARSTLGKSGSPEQHTCLSSGSRSLNQGFCWWLLLPCLLLLCQLLLFISVPKREKQKFHGSPCVGVGFSVCFLTAASCSAPAKGWPTLGYHQICHTKPYPGRAASSTLPTSFPLPSCHP